MSSLSDFLVTYDRQSVAERLRNAEAEREMLLAKYPLVDLAALPMERYASGLGQGTLCYDLEFGTKNLCSIAGGSAGKFVVFFSRKRNEWTSTRPEVPDPTAAYELLRAGLVECMHCIAAGDYAAADEVAVARYAPAVRVKLGHVYFPDKLLPLTSMEHLRHFYALLSDGEKLRVGSVAANAKLLATLREMPELADWSTLELMFLLYAWQPPGGAEESWAEFVADYDRGAAGARLAEAEEQRLAFLADYPLEAMPELTMQRYVATQAAQDTLTQRLMLRTQELGTIHHDQRDGIHRLRGTGLYRSSYQRVQEAEELWPKLRSALVDSLELAQQGRWGDIDGVSMANHVPELRTKLLHLHCPDEVLPIYKAEELMQICQRLRLRMEPQPKGWSALHNRRILEHLREDPELADWSTLELGLALQAWMAQPGPGQETRLYKSPHSSSQTPTLQPAMPTALNQILYGPPGTGKTYRVIRDAARFLQPGVNDAEAKAVFDAALRSGRVRMATFHQSFSYEDFIEGIRPAMNDNGSAGFELRDGVFKEMATEALFACLEPATAGSRDFDQSWQALLQMIQSTADGVLEVPGLGEVNWALTTTAKGNIEALNPTTGKSLSCGRAAMADVWRVCHPSQSYLTTRDVSTALNGRGAHYNVIAPIYNFMHSAAFTSAKAAPVMQDTGGSEMVQDKDGSDIVQDYLRHGDGSGWRLRADRAYPPYVLVLDEINRGNISRIFGELITLIEDDKRHGCDNALMVTLPSSRELFTVPPNLILLGTMNTADKSLALLDVALRRRFEFIELPPRFDLCTGLPGLPQVMQRINERIELRKDRDHRIGHAFFMGVSSPARFNEVFLRKVVPLLQEYFFGDDEGLRFVLGDSNADSVFLRELKVEGADSRSQRSRWRWFTDEERELDAWAVLSARFGRHAETV